MDCAEAESVAARLCGRGAQSTALRCGQVERRAVLEVFGCFNRATFEALGRVVGLLKRVMRQGSNRVGLDA